MGRRRAASAQLKLALSYVAFLTVTAVLLLAVVGLYLLRYIPDGDIYLRAPNGGTSFVPDRSDLLRAFTPVATVVLLCVLAIGIVGGWFLAGRMLRPLSAIADAARRVSRGALSHRINLTGPRDEFRQLAEVFDTMLQTLEEQVAEQRRFAANASHELRTPLAVTQTLLENAASNPEQDTATLIARLQEINVRAVDLVESLLLLSRSERRSSGRDILDLSLLTEEAVETLTLFADTYGVHIDLSSDEATTRGSSTLLQQLATNLIHNAIVHNIGEGGQIWVKVHQIAGFAVLDVENTGAVVPEEIIPTLTEPFQQGVARIRVPSRGAHAGVGLGLAIADRITRAHDGRLTITARDGGGLRTRVELPRPEQPRPGT